MKIIKINTYSIINKLIALDLSKIIIIYNNSMDYLLNFNILFMG